MDFREEKVQRFENGYKEIRMTTTHFLGCERKRSFIWEGSGGAMSLGESQVPDKASSKGFSKDAAGTEDLSRMDLIYWSFPSRGVDGSPGNEGCPGHCGFLLKLGINRGTGSNECELWVFWEQAWISKFFDTLRLRGNKTWSAASDAVLCAMQTREPIVTESIYVCSLSPQLSVFSVIFLSFSKIYLKEMLVELKLVLTL